MLETDNFVWSNRKPKYTALTVKEEKDLFSARFTLLKMSPVNPPWKLQNCEVYLVLLVLDYIRHVVFKTDMMTVSYDTALNAIKSNDDKQQTKSKHTRIFLHNLKNIFVKL